MNTTTGDVRRLELRELNRGNEEKLWAVRKRGRRTRRAPMWIVMRCVSLPEKGGMKNKKRFSVWCKT
jgi:hypothetical protein